MYLTDTTSFTTMNGITAAPFPRRSRTHYSYVKLPPGMLIEIDPLVVLPDASPSA